jgi:hypothetical protein
MARKRSPGGPRCRVIKHAPSKRKTNVILSSAPVLYECSSWDHKDDKLDLAGLLNVLDGKLIGGR